MDDQTSMMNQTALISLLRERCKVQRSARFSLATRENNRNRALADILDAFPFTKAAVRVPPRHMQHLQELLADLKFDMSDISVNPHTVHTKVDLVVTMHGACDNLPTSLTAVVIEMNGKARYPPFPLPNKTPGSAGYSEKIIRFLSAKRRSVVVCG